MTTNTKAKGLPEVSVQEGADSIEVTHVTPYGAARIVNQVLEAQGIDKVVSPQMMYNYTVGSMKKRGKTVGGLVLEDGKVTVASLSEWIQKYVAKNS